MRILDLLNRRHVLHVSWSLCTDCSSWKEPGSPKRHESRVTSRKADALTTKPRVEQLIRSTKRSKRRLYRALIRLWSAWRNCEVVRGTSKVGSMHEWFTLHFWSSWISYVFGCSNLFQIVLTISYSTTMSSPCLVYRFTPWVDDPHPAAAQSAAQRIRVHTQQRGSLLQRSESNSKTKVYPKSKWYLKLSQMSRNWQLLCTMRRQAELWNLTDLPFPKSLHPIGQKLPHLKALGDRASGTCPWVLLKEVLLQDATVHLEALLRCFPDLRLSLPRKDLPNAPIPQAPGAQSKFMELPVRFEEMFLWFRSHAKIFQTPPIRTYCFWKSTIKDSIIFVSSGCTLRVRQPYKLSGNNSCRWPERWNPCLLL